MGFTVVGCVFLFSLLCDGRINCPFGEDEGAQLCGGTAT